MGVRGSVGEVGVLCYMGDMGQDFGREGFKTGGFARRSKEDGEVSEVVWGARLLGEKLRNGVVKDVENTLR